MTALDKVKIIVVGDSGVGKSSLVYLMCHNEPIHNPSWTIGCAVDIKLHEYKEGTTEQKSFFIELWDIGGSNSHANSRGVFYTPVHGIVFHTMALIRDSQTSEYRLTSVVLVYDLTNKKSEQNLRKWLAEILNKEANGKHKSNGLFRSEYDPEQFVDSSIPIFVLGTKQDLAREVRSNSATSAQRSSLAEECGAEEIFVDCLQVKSVAPGSSNAVKLSRFFDKVIERRYFNRDSNQVVFRFAKTFLDRRRYFQQKSQHAD